MTAAKLKPSGNGSGHSSNGLASSSPECAAISLPSREPTRPRNGWPVCPSGSGLRYSRSRPTGRNCRSASGPCKTGSSSTWRRRSSRRLSRSICSIRVTCPCQQPRRRTGRWRHASRRASASARCGRLISSSAAASQSTNAEPDLGKGAGYSDIEVALLAEAGLISERTMIATTVHDLQVLDEDLPEQVHDFRVDLIVTPDASSGQAVPSGQQCSTGAALAQSRSQRYRCWRNERIADGTTVAQKCGCGGLPWTPRTASSGSTRKSPALMWPHLTSILGRRALARLLRWLAGDGQHPPCSGTFPVP